jgi:hypothetical protein
MINTILGSSHSELRPPLARRLLGIVQVRRLSRLGGRAVAAVLLLGVEVASGARAGAVDVDDLAARRDDLASCSVDQSL